MKILHVLDHSLPLHSGYVFRTLAILREQRRRGWETLSLTSPRQGPGDVDALDVEGFRFERTPYTPSWRASVPGAWPIDEIAATTASLGRLVDRWRPDVIHAHSPVLDAIPALRVGRRRGLPVVYEVRAFWEDAAVDHGSTTEGSLRYRVTRGLETAVLRRCEQVTTICEGLRMEMVGRGISPNRITVIPNAVDTVRFVPDMPRDEALAEALGLRGCRVIGFCGSFYAYEGLDLAVDALPAILGALPDVRLLLVGSGPEEGRLRARVAERGLEAHVVFTGRVPNDLIDRYYSLIDLTVFPRRRMRLTDLVTPLKPLEAMAQGKVVLASDVGGHRELVRHDETGVLFAPEDASAIAGVATRVLQDAAHASRLRLEGRRYVEHERTWASSVARYEEVYRASVAARRMQR